MIIIVSVVQSAFGTYQLASVFGAVPREILEAAALDGASRWQTLREVIVTVLIGAPIVFLIVQRTLTRGITAGAVE